MRIAIPVHFRIAQFAGPAAGLACLAQILAASALIAALQFAATPELAAQPVTQPETQPTSARSAAHKPIHARSHRAKTPSAAVAQAAPEPPPAPKLPDWPANDHPTEATVVWNSHGLRIDASNSSLSQILKDVATATGVKVDGLGADQRVFGSYGPGQARAVLNQLLDGSGYNVLMIGDRGEGTPREIVLTAQSKGATQPAANNPPPSNDENTDADDQQDQQQPPQPPMRNGFAPGAPPRTPQQIMQEMQQRQLQQMQQQNPQ